jgi:hypothetical protein
MEYVIQAGFVDGIWDEIVAKFFGAVDFVFDPLWRWYAICALLWVASLVACVVISYFCEKCRPTMGILLLLLTVGIGSFLTGAQKTRNVDNARQARADARRTKPREDPDGGGFKWPW